MSFQKDVQLGLIDQATHDLALEADKCPLSVDDSALHELAYHLEMIAYNRESE
jgi:hypothetical protein